MVAKCKPSCYFREIMGECKLCEEFLEENNEKERDVSAKIQALREPLSVIQNSAYFLNLKFKTQDDKDKKHFELIKKELEHVLSLIDDCLLK